MKKTTTKTYTIIPINSIEEVRKDYDYVYSHITDSTVPLTPETGTKEVQIVKYDKTMTTEEIIADMKENDLQPASPNALLGFAKEHFEVLEKYQWLVAPSSVFQDEGGGRCFLRVYRYGGRRELYLVRVGDRWGAGGDWMFLAEPLTSSTEILEPFVPSALIDETETELESVAEHEAIQLLKSRGYKITRLEEKEY